MSFFTLFRRIFPLLITNGGMMFNIKIKRVWAVLFMLWVGISAQAGIFDRKPQFLTSQEAFTFSSQQQNGVLALNWQIAEGYYLYQKEISLTPQNASLGEWQFPPAERYHDEFFGDVDIFRQQLTLNVPIQQAENGTVEVRYQGCTKGFCYPPETVSVTLDKALLNTQAVESTETFAKNAKNTTASPVSEQDQLAKQLSTNAFSVFWFFILGLGLAFTPCVLPMLPLLSAIVMGNKTRPTRLRAALLSFSYVQGMALTYTLLGLAVAAIGLPFQVALQSPPVLIGLSVLFILLAASMFGLFEIRLPNAWQQKLNQISQQQQGGAVGSVFVMGMIAGLIASPCTSAPLSGALLYVAQSGDLFIGALALYLLALGMGLPLMLITLFGHQVLPKSGEWLLHVKTAFGFVMLALPVFLLARVLPANAEPMMWSALAMAFLAWLISLTSGKGLFKLGLRLGLLGLFGLSAYPWANWVWQPEKVALQQPQLALTRIHSLAELETQLQDAQGKKVMLDLYADWCVACKEFEKYTFTDPMVQQKLSEMVVLQIDMTHNSPENSALMKHFQVLGLPTILFFDEQGRELTQSRVTGFLAAQPFLDWLNSLNKEQHESR